MEKREKSARQLENEQLLLEMIISFEDTYGYRRIMDEYSGTHDTKYNKKCFYRLAKIADLKTIIRHKKPAYHYHKEKQTAENILARTFTAESQK